MFTANRKKQFDYEKALIIFILALFITLVEFLFVYSYEIATGSNRFLNLADLSCEDVGGHWLSETQACEYVSVVWCSAHEGVFRECEYDCLGSKDKKNCNIVCKPTCLLNVKDNIFGDSPDSATYIVDGNLIKLSGNLLNYDANLDMRIWGIRAGGDLNNDGFDDAAMILFNSYGGKHSYYLISSLFDFAENKYLGTNSIYLGENVIIDDIDISEGQILVKYFYKEEESALDYLKVLKARIDGGNNLVKIMEALEYNNQIRLESINFGSEIKSSLILSGEARGTWFFEGSAPVVLTNWDGLIVAEGYITAQDDWMTEDFVSFQGKLDFDDLDLNNRGTLILQKDNPSGLPENDDAFELGVYFNKR